jgi:STE24 endopeptidase
VYVFESYLSLRQRTTYQQTKFPHELEECVSIIDAQEKRKDNDSSSTSTAALTTTTKEGDKENNNIDRTSPLLPQLQAKFTSAQSYGLDKVHFSLLSSTYSTIEGIVFVLLGFMPYIWDTSCYIIKTYFHSTTDDYETRNEIKISLLFLGITTIIGLVTSLPFELYSTFRIEKQHGFNKTTLSLFISDKLKGIGLTIVLGGPFVSLLLSIIKWGGSHFYVYVWGFTFTFSLFMMTLYPVVIMPLFNTYETLPDSELKTRIYGLAGQLHFPLTKLFVMDGSKRSSHSNAFMFGFFKNKRIVLFDTLLTQVHDNEILAILGHELGE